MSEVPGRAALHTPRFPATWRSFSRRIRVAMEKKTGVNPRHLNQKMKNGALLNDFAGWGGGYQRFGANKGRCETDGH